MRGHSPGHTSWLFLAKETEQASTLEAGEDPRGTTEVLTVSGGPHRYNSQYRGSRAKPWGLQGSSQSGNLNYLEAIGKRTEEAGPRVRKRRGEIWVNSAHTSTFVPTLQFCSVDSAWNVHTPDPIRTSPQNIPDLSRGWKDGCQTGPFLPGKSPHLSCPKPLRNHPWPILLCQCHRGTFKIINVSSFKIQNLFNCKCSKYRQKSPPNASRILQTRLT